MKIKDSKINWAKEWEISEFFTCDNYVQKKQTVIKKPE